MNVRLKKDQKIKIANSQDVFEIMRCILMRENRLGRQKEHFWVIGMNVQHRILYIELISLGNQLQTAVDPTEVFCLAVQKKSRRIILVHNHPTGELKPSEHDRKLTRTLRKGAALLKLEVIDHLIISEDDYVSFLDRGWIRPKNPTKRVDNCLNHR